MKHRSFALSCDETIYRLIQSIPSGRRSEMVRNAILSYTPKIKSMLKEHFQIVLERKMREKESQKKMREMFAREEEHRQKRKKQGQQLRAKEAAFEVELLWKWMDESEIDIRP